ncbi:protein of unknown function [Clostridium beijerinckii]|nr:protein of unknown function [Clostridium beijerinckii]
MFYPFCLYMFYLAVKIEFIYNIETFINLITPYMVANATI